MKCTKCGTECAEGVAFCTSCGEVMAAKDVSPAAPPPVAPPPPQPAQTGSPGLAYAPAPPPPAKAAHTADANPRPLSVLAYIGVFIVMAIPLIGLIMTVVWAITAKNRNLRNYASASLIVLVVCFLAAVAAGVAFLPIVLASPWFVQMQQIMTAPR